MQGAGGQVHGGAGSREQGAGCGQNDDYLMPHKTLLCGSHDGSPSNPRAPQRPCAPTASTGPRLWVEPTTLKSDEVWTPRASESRLLPRPRARAVGTGRDSGWARPGSLWPPALPPPQGRGAPGPACRPPRRPWSLAGWGGLRSHGHMHPWDTQPLRARARLSYLHSSTQWP